MSDPQPPQPTPSPTSAPQQLDREMFLVDVEDCNTGESFRTLSISRTPAMLLTFAANKFTEAAAAYFGERLELGTVDWRLLLLLARLPGITGSEASRTIGVDKGTVSRSAARLTTRGLILAGDIHANGRSRGLFLTAQGRALHDQVRDIAITQHLQLLDGFTPEEVALMADLLRRFTVNLEALIARDSRT